MKLLPDFGKAGQLFCLRERSLTETFKLIFLPRGWILVLPLIPPARLPAQNLL